MMIISFVMSQHSLSVKIPQVLLYAREHADEDRLTEIAVGGDEGQGVGVDEGHSDLLLEEALDDVRVLFLFLFDGVLFSETDFVEPQELPG